MTYAQFQERFEKASIEEKARYDAMPLAQMLEEIRAGRYGTNYQIWHSVAPRATITDIGWLFYHILESDTDYLNRYHCAAALLRIFNPFPDVLKPEKLTGRKKYNVDQHLAEYRDRLEEQIGPE